MYNDSDAQLRRAVIDVDAAQALTNYKALAAGARSGVRVGFPVFKARHHTTPASATCSDGLAARPPGADASRSAP